MKDFNPHITPAMLEDLKIKLKKFYEVDEITNEDLKHFMPMIFNQINKDNLQKYFTFWHRQELRFLMFFTEKGKIIRVMDPIENWTLQRNMIKMRSKLKSEYKDSNITVYRLTGSHKEDIKGPQSLYRISRSAIIWNCPKDTHKKPNEAIDNCLAYDKSPLTVDDVKSIQHISPKLRKYYLGA